MFLLISALSFLIVILIIVIYNAYGKISRDEKINELKEKTYDKIITLQQNRIEKIHLGIIPDGNRRWRKKNKCDVYEFIKRIKNIIISMIKNNHTEETKYCDLALIKELSFYVLSKDNLLKRADDTMTMIKECLTMILNDDDKDFIPWDKIKIQFIGELNLLPDDIKKLCDQITEKSRGDFIINAAIGYDPLLDAKKISDENSLRPKQSDIDLVIRTGGELRASGFFPLQTLYSEWVYIPKLFPDLNIDDINDSVQNFLTRKRNFGS
jgi:undecaprenyl diphosphate synthase